MELYCNNLFSTFNVAQLTKKLKSDVLISDYDEIGSTKTVQYIDVSDGSVSSTNITVSEGVMLFYLKCF